MNLGCFKAFSHNRQRPTSNGENTHTGIANLCLLKKKLNVTVKRTTTCRVGFKVIIDYW